MSGLPKTSSRPSRRVSGRQLEILWEFLNMNRDLAVAYNRNLQAKEYSKKKWREVASTLNSEAVGGAIKEGPEWCKYWIDYKAKLKKKVSETPQPGPVRGESRRSRRCDGNLTQAAARQALVETATLKAEAIDRAVTALEGLLAIAQRLSNHVFESE